MRLDDAMSQISEIRNQVAKTETFRGYRALTVAGSGVIGVAFACIQANQVPVPRNHPLDFVAVWVAAAVLSVVLVGVELVYDCTVAASPRRRRQTLVAVQQFVPCLVAGALLTGLLARHSLENVWMLPGLWAMLFSLGVFASCRLLPPLMAIAGVYYLLAGCLCLAWASQEKTTPPWMMGGTFGGGQLLTAALLYWSLERNHE